ncbi:multidrug ABC transporter ATPase [Fervidicella metallireducens AeB]|uniref:Multidrug ABC transporter ATPase n=1 Tax=Fervidicella metallireducens AeB TaxID=1403537 RepID=A0A017RWY9_9CLOT|nr:ABC transporter ATP-binding protein [Fervidicella metallireducens]EYE88919.1 multidrug ABC transporter ATPase [Fervidicella metallireducens AeB]
MIKIDNLYKKYGNFEALKGISFEIKKGSIHGFLGPNGAGKTTTMNILSGLIDYDMGNIFYYDLEFKKNRKDLLKKIGYLPQTPVFYSYMNAIEYLGFIGEINGLSKREVKSKTEELLNLVKLDRAKNKKIAAYSGGMKQRLGIAVALFNNPEFLILDEPTSALDPEGRMEVLEFVKKLKDTGTTILLSTHILGDVERVCDDVSIIDRGQLLVCKNIEKLKNEYIQPVIDIEFEKNCSNIAEELKNIDWIENVKVNNKNVRIFVSDLCEAKRELINLIVNRNNPIVAYNIRKSDLEDVFMRLVNKNEDI